MVSANVTTGTHQYRLRNLNTRSTCTAEIGAAPSSGSPTSEVSAAGFWGSQRFMIALRYCVKFVSLWD